MRKYEPIQGIGFDIKPGIFRISLEEISLKTLYIETLKKYNHDPPKNQKEVHEKVDAEKRIKAIEEAFNYIEKEFRKPIEELLIKKFDNDKSMSMEEIMRKYHNDHLPSNDPKQINESNIRKALQRLAYGMAVIDGRIKE